MNKVEAIGSPLRMEVEKAAKEHEQAVLNVRVQRLRDQLAADPSFLSDTAHPIRRGETLRNYAEFVLVNGGPKALKRICTLVENRSK